MAKHQGLGTLFEGEDAAGWERAVGADFALKAIDLLRLLGQLQHGTALFQAGGAIGPASLSVKLLSRPCKLRLHSPCIIQIQRDTKSSIKCKCGV